MTSAREPSGMRYGAIERDDALVAGTLVAAGAYRLGAVLGRGGMATVYSAERVDDGELVAFKIVASKIAHRSDIAARMRNELELAAKLGNHPNIVRPLAGGRLPEAGNAPYLVTELARGPALADLIVMQRQLAVLPAVQIARDIARAVLALHECEIVHRDIKPDNIVVVKTTGGQVAKLIDFGLATTSRRSTADKRLTAVFERPGTRHYMAPEQAAGADVDSAFDVYALGVTLFEMLVGAPPMGERSEDEVIARKLDQGQPSFSIVGLRDGLPAPLCAVVDACLRSLPSERLSPRMLVAALERLEAELTDGASIEAPVGIAANVAPATGSAPVVRSRARRLWWIGPVAVATTAALWIFAPEDAAIETPDAVPAAIVETARDPVVAPTHRVVESTIRPPTAVPAPPAEAPAPITMPQIQITPPQGPRVSPVAKVSATAPSPWSPQCVQRRERVAVLVDDDPARALDLLRERACWDSVVTHRRLRVRALVAADRYDECARVARGSSDAEVRSYLELCLAKAGAETKAGE